MKIALGIIISLLIVSFSYGKEIIEKFDRNRDGKIDTWSYKEEGSLKKWINDSDFDGQKDEWIFYKNDGSQLIQRDRDRDGKIDTIIISMNDLANKTFRNVHLVLQDEESNLFIEEKDTGWKPITTKTSSKK